MNGLSAIGKGFSVPEDYFEKGNPGKLNLRGTSFVANEATVDFGTLRNLTGNWFHLGFVYFERGTDPVTHAPTITIRRAYRDEESKANVTCEKNRAMRDAVARSFGPAMKYMSAEDVQKIRGLLKSTALGQDSQKTNQKLHAQARESFAQKIAAALYDHKWLAGFVAGQAVGAVADAVKAFVGADVLPEDVGKKIDDLKKLGQAEVKKLIARFVEEHADSFVDDNEIRGTTLKSKEIKQALDVFDRVFSGVDGRARVVDLMLQNVMNDTGLNSMPRFFSDSAPANALQRIAYLNRELQGVAVKPTEGERKGTDVGNCLGDLLLSFSPDEVGKMSPEQFLAKVQEAEALLRKKASKAMIERTIRFEMANQMDLVHGGWSVPLQEDTRKRVLNELETGGTFAGVDPEAQRHLSRMFVEVVLPGMMDKALAEARAGHADEGKGDGQTAQRRPETLLTADKIIEAAENFASAYGQGKGEGDIGSKVRNFTEKYMLDNYPGARRFDKVADEQAQKLEERTHEYEMTLAGEKRTAKELHKGETSFRQRLDAHVNALNHGNGGEPNQAVGKGVGLDWTKADIGLTDYSVLVAMKEKGGYIERLMDHTLKKVAHQAAKEQNLKKSDDKTTHELLSRLNNELSGAKRKVEAVWDCVKSKQHDFVIGILRQVEGEIDSLVKDRVVKAKYKKGLLDEARQRAAGAYAEIVSSFLENVHPALSVEDIEGMKFDSTYAAATVEADIKSKLYEKILNDKDSRFNLVNGLPDLPDMVNASVNNKANFEVADKFGKGPDQSRGDGLPDSGTIRTSLKKRFKTLWNTAQTQVSLSNMPGLIELVTEKKKLGVDNAWFAAVRNEFDASADALVKNYGQLETELVEGCRRQVENAVKDALRKKGASDAGVCAALVGRVMHAYSGAIREQLSNWLDKPERAVLSAENLRKLVFTAEIGGTSDLSGIVTRTIAQAEADVTAKLLPPQDGGNRGAKADVFGAVAFLNGSMLAGGLENDPLRNRSADKTSASRDVQSTEESFRDKLDRNSQLNDPKLSREEAAQLGDVALGGTLAAVKSSPLLALGTKEAGPVAQVLLKAAEKAKPLVGSYLASRDSLDGMLEASFRQSGKARDGSARKACMKLIHDYFSMKFCKLAQAAKGQAPDRKQVGALETECKTVFEAMLADFDPRVTYACVEEYKQTAELKKELLKQLDRSFSEMSELVSDALSKNGIRFGSQAYKAVQTHVSNLQARQKSGFLKLAHDILKDEKTGVKREDSVRRAFAELKRGWVALVDHVSDCVAKLKVTDDDLTGAAVRDYLDVMRKGSDGSDDAVDETVGKMFAAHCKGKSSLVPSGPQHDDYLAMLLSGTLEQGWPLDGQDVETVAASCKAQAMKGVLKDVLDDTVGVYGRCLFQFQRYVANALEDKVLPLDELNDIRTQLMSRMAQDVKSFEEQYGASSPEIKPLLGFLSGSVAWAQEKVDELAKSSADRDKSKLGVLLSRFGRFAKDHHLPEFNPAGKQREDRTPHEKAIGIYDAYAQAQNDVLKCYKECFDITTLQKKDNWLTTLTARCADVGKQIDQIIKAAEDDLDIKEMKFRTENDLDGFAQQFDKVWEKLKKDRVWTSTPQLKGVDRELVREKCRLHETHAWLNRDPKLKRTGRFTTDQTYNSFDSVEQRGAKEPVNFKVANLKELPGVLERQIKAYLNTGKGN